MQFPVLYMMTFLFIHSKCSNNLHLPMLDSQSIPLPPHIPPWQPQICSLWVCFCFVDRFICGIFQIPYKSDSIWYFFLFLVYFTSYDNLYLHPFCCRWHYFFLMAEGYAIVCMHHLMHSSADGHRGCLHVLAIVNSATMSIGVRVYF